MSDLIRDTFLKFVADGMSNMEALEQFDPEQFRLAMNAEIMSGEARDRDDEKSLLDLASRAGFEKRNQKDFDDQVVPLMMAGWIYEVPDSYKTNSRDFWRQVQWMSMYWRAPSKRPGKPGRKYLSTQQAFNAMMRQTS